MPSDEEGPESPQPADGPDQPTTRRSLGVLVGLIVVVTGGVFAGWKAMEFGTAELVGEPVRLARSVSAKLPPLLIAGHWIYFQEQTKDYARYVMMQASTSGREPRRMELPLENPDPGVVAPDGSAMLLRSVQGSKDGDEPLYLQPLPTGKPIRLGDIRAYDSAWTPDRSQIVFSRQRSVYLASREGRILRKLFDVPGRAYRFRWSPRTGSLRFSVYDSKLSSYRIWQAESLDAQPSPAELGVAHLTQQCCGEWSPDGRFFYFQAMVAGFYHAFAHDETPAWLRLGRAATVKLTSGPLNYRSPIPTRDNRALILLTQSQKSELVYYEAAQRRWLPFLDGVSAAAAAFSPDGQWLAYTRPSDHTLWRCRMPACMGPIQLTAPPQRITMPRWSPDGSQIACMIRTLGKPWRAAVLPASGGHVRYLVPAPGEQADPDWSPAGDRIVFGTAPNPDSGSEAQLWELEIKTGALWPISGSRGYHTPRWSPDGRFIAAVRSGNLEPAVFDIASGRWAALPGKRVGYLNWSSDSSTLFLLSGAGTKEPVFLAVHVADRTAKVMADLSTVRKPAFSFGDWVGVGPGGTPLALRDLSTEEVLCWPLSSNSSLTRLVSGPSDSPACR